MIKKIPVVLFFLFTALIYLHNLTRDIYGGDIGDLVTAAYVFGVPHAPGYPLFTLLGSIFSHLSLSLPPVSRVALISVFSSLLALIIYYKFSLKTTKSVFLSLLSVSILAFSYLFWLNAEIPEVFALNNLFVVIILYLGILFYQQKKTKQLYMLAFFTGLSLTHHFTIILIFPSVLILILKHFKFIFLKKRFLWSVLLFLIGFAFYIYVPVAASRNPPINWDNASNLKNFVHLFLRKDYGVAPDVVNSVPLEIKLIHIHNYFKTIISVFSYQIILLALVGLMKLWKKDKRLFVSLLIGFFLSGALSISYAASIIVSSAAWGIIERFYTLSTVVFMFFIPYGLIFLKEFLDSKFSKKIYSYLIISYFLIIPVLLFKYNQPKTDLSKTKIGNTLARNILSNLPNKAVLFVSGDTTTFNIWYLYYVLKERQDIDIINPQGVGNNIFLDKELNDYYKKFPDTSFDQLITKTFAKIRTNRRMFTNRQISTMPKDTALIPKGLFFEVIDKKNIPQKEEYLKEIESILNNIKIQRRKTLTQAEENFITPEIPFIYSKALVNIGDFIDSQYKDPIKAEHYYRRALWIDDTNTQAYSGLAISLYKGYRDCNSAIENINVAISLYPIWMKYYIQKYFFYNKCQVNKKIIEDFKKEFKIRFNQDIDKQIN